VFTLTFTTPLLLLLLPLVLGWAAWLWLRDAGNLSPLRHRLALALRLTILGALVLALSGATWQQPETRQATVFVADLSASVAGAADAETSYIAHALKARGRDDAAGVVSVGADALVEQPVGQLRDFTGFQSLVDRGATNLEEGLNLAGALFPVGYRKRVVVLTDGRQNIGDALGAARLLRDEDARVDVVPLTPASGPEASVVNVQAPSSLRQGANLPLTVKLRSNVAQTATLDVYEDGTLLSHPSMALGVGDTIVQLPLPPPTSGYHNVHVVLQAPLDTIAQNNDGYALTRVRGAPRVLVAEGSPGEGAIVAASLRAKGMTVAGPVTGDQLQPSTAYLGGYDAVALVDVPAYELDQGLLDPQHSPLRSYVDGGGGLVVIGGPQSYGVGGYTGTALDDLLPVSMKLPQRKDTPSVAVALIIESLESDQNVNISKAAGEGVVKLLTPQDRVAVNDANGVGTPGNGWTVPLQYVTNKTAINRAIDAMNPIDPGSYSPSLQAAYDTLTKSGAKIKHIILLGDGDAPDDYYPLVSKIHKAGITISTVATGAAGGGPSDYGEMQDIARWGGGHYYQADNPSNIPQIFLKETKQIARTGIVEEHFVPEVLNYSAGGGSIIDGVPAAPLDGYVATTEKPLGEEVLVHVTKHGVDPLLAQWQYGLGRVVAWTSDAQGRWTASLIGSKAGNRLWSNMVSYVLPPESSPYLSLASAPAGGMVHLTVTTTGLPLDAGVTARVDSPTTTQQQQQGQRQRSTTLPLQPTAPGQYEGDVPAAEAGAYIVNVTAAANGHKYLLRSGVVVPYAPEYRDTGLDTGFVRQMAATGGGALLAMGDAAASFADNVPPVYAPRPLTVPLLLLALLLLPFDIATRRLLIGLTEIREGLAALRRRRALTPALAGASMAAAAPLTNVRAQRSRRQERVAARSVQQPEPVPADIVSRSGREPAAPAAFTARPGASSGRVATPARLTARQESVPPPVISPPAPEPAVEPGATAVTASKLLEAKRKRRGG